MAIPWNIRGAFRSLSNTHDCVLLQKFSMYHRYLVGFLRSLNWFMSYQEVVGLRLKRMFECCKCFRKFVAKLIAFYEKGVGRKSTIACPTSYMLVIKSSRIFKRRILQRSETVAWMCSVKLFFLKVLQYLQENTCGGVSFSIKLKVFSLQLYQKKRLQYRCFPGNFAKILRNVILSTTSGDCF